MSINNKLPVEETTAFQPPEDTRTCSKAQVVCLRQEEEAPPPTNSAEALNGDVLTRVLTPIVAAQPDGVHLHINNRLSRHTSYSQYVNGEYSGTDNIPKGISNHAIESPPGEVVELQRDPITDRIPCETMQAYFLVVVGESGYKSLELKCVPGAPPSFSTFVACEGGSKFDVVRMFDPLERARAHSFASGSLDNCPDDRVSCARITSECVAPLLA
jgi:hypothetical protein